MKPNTTQIGNAAERVAENFYVRSGYQLVARNFRCARGEIDLILFHPHQSELLIVEVKGRRTFDTDQAWLPRWHRKKARIHGALLWFLAQSPEWERRSSGTLFEIVYVTQGRVSERFVDEPFPG
jgi:Holliday junction resolvase-like predicted endonuclease